MLLTWLLFFLGLFLMVFAGDRFVDSATMLARKSGIPSLLIGATIVAFATTVPEMAVSSLATIAGQTDMAVGNAIGSIICNTCLIVAITLSFSANQVSKDFKSKAALLLLVLFLTFLFALDDQIVLWEAVVLVALLVFYFAVNIRQSQIARKENNLRENEPHSYLYIVMVFLVSIVGVVLGSRLLIDNGVSIAHMLGVPTAVIALTMIALGTSLPELVTTVTALRKQETGLSIGNVLGANILNILLIVSVCALISGGLHLTDSLVLGHPFRLTTFVDLPLAFLSTCIFVLPPMVKGRTYRWQGVILLLLYLAYLLFLYTCVR